MNLDKLNVQEMTVEEAREVSGGWRFSFRILGLEIIGYDSGSNGGWTTDLW